MPTINGTNNGETLSGSANADEIFGFGGDDIINAMGGNDVIDSGYGNDTVNGGFGNNTLTFANDIRNLVVDLSAGTAIADDSVIELLNATTTQAVLDAAIAGNIYFNVHTTTFGGGEIRGQTGTVASDTTDGSGVRTVIFDPIALDGSQETPARDTDALGVASLVFVVQPGGTVSYSTSIRIENLPIAEITASHLHNAPAGSNGGVVANILGNSAATLTTVTEIDMIGAISNVIGGVGNDIITGNNAPNILDGGAGDDILQGGRGADTLNGGSGYDTASYADSNNRVDINLLAGTATGGRAINDTLISIENLIGSNFGDILRGDNAVNVLMGHNGNDTLIGFSGDDKIYGGAGRDILNGGDGADIVDGGDGVDQARYNGSSAAVQIDLLAGTATGGQAQGDTLINIENLFGSNHNDTLFGDTNNNQIFGHNGDDALAAGGGICKLYGGSGSDSFVLSDGFAFVMDFVDDVDQLDVSDYGFATLADALMNVDQVGNHARFRFDGDVLFVLNTDADDLSNDIVI